MECMGGAYRLDSPLSLLRMCLKPNDMYLIPMLLIERAIPLVPDEMLEN